MHCSGGMDVSGERKQVSINTEHKKTSMLRDCRVNHIEVKRTLKGQPEEK